MAELRKHADVDVYGKCGGLLGVVGAAGHERHMALLRKYKARAAALPPRPSHSPFPSSRPRRPCAGAVEQFYLAFENALCKDYVTEKFWVDALLTGAIPARRRATPAGGRRPCDTRSAGAMREGAWGGCDPLSSGAGHGARARR